MPFRPALDEIYREVVQSACNGSGLSCVRADEIVGPTRIMDDIWDAILNSKILIADLTDKNPNVMYELGLAHAQSKPVVLITQAIELVPFDLSHVRVIEYQNTRVGRKLLLDKVNAVLSTILQNLERGAREEKYAVLDAPQALVSTSTRKLTAFKLGIEFARLDLYFDINMLIARDEDGLVDYTYSAIEDSLDRIQVDIMMSKWVLRVEPD